jgi:hypothetical protein
MSLVQSREKFLVHESLLVVINKKHKFLQKRVYKVELRTEQSFVDQIERLTESESVIFQVGEQQVNCHAANVLFFFSERFGIGVDVQGLVSVQSSILAPPRPQLK